MDKRNMFDITLVLKKIIDEDQLIGFGHTDGITAVAISFDGKLIVTGSQDYTAKIWDSATGKLISTLEGHVGRVTSVAISSDNKFIVTGSKDTTARLWDSTTGQPIATLDDHTDRVTSVAISSDNKFIVTGSDDGTARVWNVRYVSNTMTIKELIEYSTHNLS